MPNLSKRLAAAVAVPTVALTGCYIVPIAPDGTPVYPYPYPYPYPHSAAVVGAQTMSPPAAVIVGAPPSVIAGAPPPTVVAGSPAPTVLYARLYPTNDVASQTGMIAGTVTNMMTGKGRFQMEYKGEVLTGEATRVSGDERRGVASAYGPRGTYMSCEYRMTSPYQGAGSCTLSTGAQYQVHLGS